MTTLSSYLAVLIGSALGGIGRFYIYSFFITHSIKNITIPTFLVNCLGSFFIGILWFLCIDKIILSSFWKQIIMIGFLGAFTTFSTFSLDLLRLIQADAIFQAFLYGLITVLSCLGSTMLGYYGLRWLSA